MIHRTWPHIRVSSRRPRYAQEYSRRHSSGGASRDAGRAAARAIWLRAGPPHLVVGGRWPPPHGDRRGPLLLALQRVPHGAGLSGGHARLGTRRSGAAHASTAHHRAAPHDATVAAGHAQGTPPGLWVEPRALELCHTGPDPAG